MSIYTPTQPDWEDLPRVKEALWKINEEIDHLIDKKEYLEKVIRALSVITHWSNSEPFCISVVPGYKIEILNIKQQKLTQIYINANDNTKYGVLTKDLIVYNYKCLGFKFDFETAAKLAKQFVGYAGELPKLHER